MKKTKLFFRRTLSLILVTAMLVSMSVCAFAASDMISDETRAKSIEIANQIESEGIVLLKNDDGFFVFTTNYYHF